MVPLTDHDRYVQFGSVGAPKDVRADRGARAGERGERRGGACLVLDHLVVVIERRGGVHLGAVRERRLVQSHSHQLPVVQMVRERELL